MDFRTRSPSGELRWQILRVTTSKEKQEKTDPKRLPTTIPLTEVANRLHFRQALDSALLNLRPTTLHHAHQNIENATTFRTASRAVVGHYYLARAALARRPDARIPFNN